MLIDLDFLSKNVKNSYLQNGPFSPDSSFVVDSRNVSKGDVFIALKGQMVDGHDFIDQALTSGAGGFILSLEKKEFLLQKYKTEFAGKVILFVPDTLQALLDLAKAWRSQFSYPVVAITGTVGKTTTKEMVRNILKFTDLKYIVSSGNQNTLIGISLNILKMRQDHQAAVFELGIAQRGSMKKLVELLRPTYSLITVIGHGHTQGLGGMDVISYEKREIFSCFTDRDIGIINGDQPELADISYIHPVIRFGKKTTNQIQARKIATDKNTVSFIAKIYNKRYAVVLPSCNESRVMNALAAICVGYVLGISDDILIKGVQEPVIVPGRFEMIPHSSGSMIIHDGYNSNPESVKASLAAFEKYQTDKKKIVVLGDMLELGAESPFWHRQLGRLLHKVSDVNHVILIGKEIEWTKKSLPIGMKSSLFATIDDAFDSLKNMLLQKDKVFLFKASNSIKFSDLIKKLQEV
ncbi:MAG: UDP-N-acetylmuramoyl-tripeptide--D-alanyl-D-alanine ligase [Candidatus Dependentiae bacterium]|nr:UDP-N-acetylmuramoyl-tripeptide--D-alanyl-D-alanine ligase [Candidatus Dependentiae bacterium]